MEFFNSAIDILKVLVIALGAGLAVWGVINLLEGYGSDNPAAKSQGIKQLMAGGGVVLIGTQLIPCLLYTSFPKFLSSEYIGFRVKRPSLFIVEPKVHPVSQPVLYETQCPRLCNPQIISGKDSDFYTAVQRLFQIIQNHTHSGLHEKRHNHICLLYTSRCV